MLPCRRQSIFPDAGRLTKPSKCTVYHCFVCSIPLFTPLDKCDPLPSRQNGADLALPCAQRVKLDRHWSQNWSQNGPDRIQYTTKSRKGGGQERRQELVTSIPPVKSRGSWKSCSHAGASPYFTTRSTSKSPSKFSDLHSLVISMPAFLCFFMAFIPSRRNGGHMGVTTIK
jgi:hypothetical protein